MQNSLKVWILIAIVIAGAVVVIWVRPTGTTTKPVVSPTLPAPAQPSEARATPLAETSRELPRAAEPSKAPSQEVQPPSVQPPRPAAQPPAQPGGATSALGVIAQPRRPGEPSVESIALETDLENVQVMFREYRNALGENPVGTNAEIMRAVLGDNLKQLKLSAPDGSTLNANGELVDRWGTPYFFHQISAVRMEIRSAGPDRVMWTGDDQQK